ncbi:MAG: hypothetical protein IKI08_02700 [Selenomonadaceae bacterium]|nr:hypothetical protein [Selenomonadaceae bacterium]
MTGYYKLRPEEQTIDAEGRLHLTGRIKEIIIRGGENIYPAEVEEAISEDEIIDDVKVIGVPQAESRKNFRRK